MDKLWLDILFNIDASGSVELSRNGPCTEILGFSAKLEDVNQNFLFSPIRKLDPYYACAEFLWYLSMTDDTTFLQMFAPSYKLFCEDKVHAFGAYGWRWIINSESRSGSTGEDARSGGDQLIDAIETLRCHPESRQAVMTMWHGTDLIHALALDKKDLPCTLTHQFLLRNGYLHMITTMRSNDAWLGFPYDVFCNTQLLKLIADELGVEAGTYTHNAGSMHYYERNFERIDEILRSDSKVMMKSITELPYGVHKPKVIPDDISNQVTPAIKFVKAMKEIKIDSRVVETVKLYHSVIADAAFVCAAKWKPELKEHIVDPVLKLAVENFNS